MPRTPSASDARLEVGSVTTVIGRQNVPAKVLSLVTLGEPDYVDCFTIATPRATERSAEEWARAILELAPLARRSTRPLWRLMGLRLGPPNSPDHVQGWRIAERGDVWLRVETGSWYASAQAVCLVEEGRISISLSLHYDRLPAAVIWAIVSGPHQRAVPVMLRQAMRLMTT
jgi:hypothetical protein